MSLALNVGIGGNALVTKFERWIWGDQISSSKATNVIAAVGTKLNGNLELKFLKL